MKMNKAAENQKIILVVEDNGLNMELVTDILRAAGFAVIQAESAEQGLAAAWEFQPDLILMDVALPGMDGLTAAQILRQDRRSAAIPVVALTAHAMKGDRECAQEMGCAAYITKPIDTRSFARQISHLLAGHGAGQQQ